MTASQLRLGIDWAIEVPGGPPVVWWHIPVEAPFASRLYDRHYSRQTPGAKGVLAPGKRFLLWHEPRSGRRAAVAQLYLPQREQHAVEPADHRGDRVHVQEVARALWRVPFGSAAHRGRHRGDQRAAITLERAGPLLPDGRMDEGARYPIRTRTLSEGRA